MPHIFARRSPMRNPILCSPIPPAPRSRPDSVARPGHAARSHCPPNHHGRPDPDPMHPKAHHPVYPHPRPALHGPPMRHVQGVERKHESEHIVMAGKVQSQCHLSIKNRS
jgi:hypothetical protein